MSKAYNGHANWTQWNVSLWINNDEGLYIMALDAINQTKNRHDAAKFMLDCLYDMGITATKDGAVFSATAIRRALIGIE